VQSQSLLDPGQPTLERSAVFGAAVNGFRETRGDSEVWYISSLGGVPMSRNVRCGLIQASNALGSNRSLPEIKKAMIDKHLKLIEQAAKKKGENTLPPGTFLRSLFLRRAGPSLVRPYRARSQRTNHPSFKEQKELGRDDFTKIPNGGPGIEHRMSLIYSGGVAQGRFSVNRFVELVSTTPAKLFGLYPRKGTIAVGSDADLVIFDPNRKHTISVKTHHTRVDYSMFEGIQVTGMPDAVLSRGRVVVEVDKFLGRAGAGAFLKRSLYTQP